jgi:hypothetical protein
MAIDTTAPRSRRALLAAAFGAAAATVASAVARPLPTRAVYDSVSYANDVDGGVVLQASSIHKAGNPNSGYGFGVYGTSTSGRGVYGYSKNGTGVRGQSVDWEGVQGESTNGVGVHAKSEHNNAIRAETTDTDAIFATSATKAGILAASTSWAGVWGQSVSSTGTVGYSADGIGVSGSSPNGRGGVFGGKRAQLRLLPSTAVTHPTAGQMGDLFVDKSGRLWYCRKGGNPAIWKRVQLV